MRSETQIAQIIKGVRGDEPYPEPKPERVPYGMFDGLEGSGPDVWDRVRKYGAILGSRYPRVNNSL